MLSVPTEKIYADRKGETYQNKTSCNSVNLVY